jgi:hypothetical protein
LERILVAAERWWDQADPYFPVDTVPEKIVLGIELRERRAIGPYSHKDLCRFRKEPIERSSLPNLV